MGAFEYVAVDSAGRERKGVLEGDTPRHVRQLLREQSMLPVAVKEVTEQETSHAGVGTGRLSIRYQRGLSAADLSLVTRQLATLVKSSLPLEEALLAVSQQTDKPRVRNIMLGVRSKVMEGHTLADGLAEFPNSFPEVYRATIAASEQSGHLDAVMERLADYTENREALRSRTLGAMLYPVLLFVVCVAIVFFLLVSVVPKVVEVFRNSEAELPLLTQALIAGSDFMRALRRVPGRRHRGRDLAVPARAAHRVEPAPLARVPAAAAADRQGRARLQHRAVRAHAEHADCEHGARARRAAHLRRGRDQPADEGRRERRRGARA